MSGITRSTPSMSSLGNIKPASATMILPSYSMAIMFRPISPSPPSGMTFSSWAISSSHGPNPASSSSLTRLYPVGASPILPPDSEQRQLLLLIGLGLWLGGLGPPGLDHVDVAAHLLEIDFEGVDEEAVVEGRGRVVQRYVGTVPPLHQLAVDPRDAVRTGQQPLHRVSPQEQDHRRPDQLHLAIKVRRARGHLLRQRVAVARRPALDDVGDVDLVAVDPNRLQQLVEELAGLAHEGQPLLVLVLSRGLAHDHDPSLCVARARHRLRPRAMEGAKGAFLDLLVKDLKRFAQARSSIRRSWTRPGAASGRGRRVPRQSSAATAPAHQKSRS